jgi:hypothetical protein
MRFATEILAMGDAHRISIFSDEAPMVEGPQKRGVWKVMGLCNVGRYPKEQHGIGAMARARPPERAARVDCSGALHHSMSTAMPPC